MPISIAEVVRLHDEHRLFGKDVGRDLAQRLLAAHPAGLAREVAWGIAEGLAEGIEFGRTSEGQ